jgi:hypothetical protein
VIGSSPSSLVFRQYHSTTASYSYIERMDIGPITDPVLWRYSLIPSQYNNVHIRINGVTRNETARAKNCVMAPTITYFLFEELIFGSCHRLSPIYLFLFHFLLLLKYFLQGILDISLITEDI